MRKIVFIALALFWQSPLLAAPDCANWSSEDFWRDASAEDVSRCFSGANLEAPDKYGDTPLHWAAARGKPANIKALLDAGADAGARTTAGSTALDLAQMHDLRDEPGGEEVWWLLNDATYNATDTN